MALIIEPARELAQQTTDNITSFKTYHLQNLGMLHHLIYISPLANSDTREHKIAFLFVLIFTGQLRFILTLLQVFHSSEEHTWKSVKMFGLTLNWLVKIRTDKNANYVQP